jgi:hypothetical protein
MFNGKIHYKWQFSIAMLNYQRVYLENMKVSGQIILNPKAGFQQIEPSAGVGSQRRTKFLWLCPGIGYPKIRLLLINSPQKLAIWV